MFTVIFDDSTQRVIHLEIMNKILIIFSALIVFCNFASAQDSEFDDLTMNGLASYQKLSTDYFIAALFLESMSSDPDEIVNMPGLKRMELRVVNDSWSPRRFSKEFKNGILLSNSPEFLEDLTTQIQSFTGAVKNDLIKGDRIIIDMYPERHTTIYLNNKRVFRTINNNFFYALLNTWIGSKPPSTEFKNDILKLPTDELGTQLLVQFENLNFSEKRQKTVAGWFKKEQTEKDKASNNFAPPRASVTAAIAAAPIAIAPKTPSANDIAKEKAKQLEAKKAAELLEKMKAEMLAAEAKAAEAEQALKAAEQAKAREEALDEQRASMYNAIAEKVRYPKRSEQRGERGRVVIKATVDRAGKLISVEQETASKFSRLNKAAEKAVTEATPFNPIPDDIEGETFEFSFPIVF